jgi:prepilin-type N-terminal cleavage/methylation domain-containing protein
MSNERAFTLIEMIAVIVIIGIIVAVGIPAMTSLTRAAGLQGGVRQIMNAAQLTRQFAITHRTPAELRIQTTSFSVFTNSIQIDKWTFLPVGVVVDFSKSSASVNSIVFMPTGALSPNASDQFIAVREGTTNNATLVALNSNMSTVTVNAILGRISVQ